MHSERSAPLMPPSYAAICRPELLRPAYLLCGVLGAKQKGRAFARPFFPLGRRGLLPAEQPRVESELNLVRKEFRLISARALHRLPVQVGHFERDSRLSLLE